jgi:hypothetical protein
LQNAWCVFTQSPPKGHARSHHSVPGIFSRWTVPPFIPLPHACPKFWFWGSCVPFSPLFFCVGVRRGRPGTFLAGRHSTLSASTSSPARAHYQAFLPILFVRSHHPVRLETPGVPFFHRVPTTRVQCRAREACVPAILTCSPPHLRTLPWTALPVASTRAPAFGDRPKNYAMRSNEQRK